MANLIGEDLIAAHMTWGAINEWPTHAGYARLIQREDHPVDYQVSNRFAGRKITLRLNGHLMHAIADNTLIAIWPCPIGIDELPNLRGARIAVGPLPPPLPAGTTRVTRRISQSGRIMVATQRLKLGKKNAGKHVTVIIEDTHNPSSLS